MIEKLKKRNQILKYCIGGFLGFLFDLLLIYIFVDIGIHKDIAFLLGFFISALTLGFVFHQNITFCEARRRGLKVFRLYLIANIFIFIIDIYGAIIFSNILISSYLNTVYDRELLILAGKTIGAALAGITSFLTLKFIVFK